MFEWYVKEAMFNIPFKIKRLAVMGLVCGYVFLFFAYYQLPDEYFHIYFLNVGQGDSILIKTPENHQILVDGGPENKVIEELADIMPFFDKSIDLVVLTHPHADHIDGLTEVLKRYKIGYVLFTGVNFDNRVYDEFLNEIDLQNISVFIAESEVNFSFGDVLLDIVYPRKQIIGEEYKNLNNSSIGMRILYKDISIMLAGDMEIPDEKQVLDSGIIVSADILKVGHHGSKSASSDEFLKNVDPKIAVIQVGEGNSFSHPHIETLKKFEQMGITVFRNDLDGRVEFKF